jgi:hypothetical protein
MNNEEQKEFANDIIKNHVKCDAFVMEDIQRNSLTKESMLGYLNLVTYRWLPHSAIKKEKELTSYLNI